MKKVLPLYNSEKGSPFIHIKFKWNNYDRKQGDCGQVL